VRDILRQAVAMPAPVTGHLGSEIVALFKDIGLRDGEDIQETRGFAIKPWNFDDCCSWIRISCRS
jgi:hypothetical protein